MPTLWITRGLPGSGKTTRARNWVEEDPENRARVNRDDLRAMLHGGRLGAEWQEEQVTIAQRAQVAALLRAGVNVIADDTNLPNASVEAWRRLAADCGADLRILDLRDVPVEVCIANDAARGAAGGRLVGERVIRKMAARRNRVLSPPS